MEKFSLEPLKDNDEISDFRKEEAYLRAKKKVDALMGFYWHLAVYIVVNGFLILLIGLNSNEGFSGFGPYATAVFWGIGLFFHFIGVFGPDFLFGKNWEKRKIKEFMDKEESNWE
ncbi:MAG: 2TM domain-containing protein [Winogradskyella sp.]|uniref:2TM domain-containing protein n=1 Tax=Winogradskyella sp. TaxID=1883156 RepID=UPI0025F09870|nr:2TM domain-containing protein [Winogradskyella sp.]NRB58577.1 2TM domain-containing protein [Winogradskyella sp.]